MGLDGRFFVLMVVGLLVGMSTSKLGITSGEGVVITLFLMYGVPSIYCTWCIKKKDVTTMSDVLLNSIERNYSQRMIGTINGHERLLRSGVEKAKKGYVRILQIQEEIIKREGVNYPVHECCLGCDETMQCKANQTRRTLNLPEQ